MEFQKKPRLTPNEISLFKSDRFCCRDRRQRADRRQYWTQQNGRGGGEFYSAWIGARMFLFNHVDPYNIDVALQAQQLAYGHAAATDKILII